MPRTIPTVPAIRRSASPWLYFVIGILAAGVIGLGLLLLFLWTSDKRVDNETAKASPSPAATNTPATTTPRPAANANNVVPPSNSLPSPSVDLDQVRTAIASRLARWEHDAESQNLESYMINYADVVDYYRTPRASRAFVRNDKARAFSQFTSIDITIDNVSVVPADDGRTARAVFDKSWIFTGDTVFKGKVRQELRFVKRDGDWLISGERDIRRIN